MDQKQMLMQMIEYNKSFFDNTFNNLAALQDQMEKAANMLLDQAVWFPGEGKKAVDEWVRAYKKGRENFKSAVDESFRKVETFFAEKA